MKISINLKVKEDFHSRMSFLLFLLDLKLVFLFNLSERFNVSVFLISKTFTTWITFLCHELPLYFPFPSQKLLRKYLPLLRKYLKF